MTDPARADWRPDPRCDDPQELGRRLERRLLPLVARPARYVGGERGAEPAASWREAGCNVLLCFPDAYEVGMSHTGLRILYTVLNDRDDAFCDLAFAPWPDMENLMRGEGVPLFGLQTRRPARQFDLLGFSLGYELGYTNMLTMLSLAGVPLRAAARGGDDPIVAVGGACTMNPAVIGPFCDLALPGDGEQILAETAGLIAAGRAAGDDRARILERLRRQPGAWWPGVAEPVRARVFADLNGLPPPRELVPVTEPVHDRLTIEVMRGCTRGCRFCQAGMIQRPVRERDAATVAAAVAGAARTTGHGEVGLLSLSTSDYSGLGAAVAGAAAPLAATHTNLVLPSLRMDGLDEAVRAQLGRERPAGVTFAPEAGTQRLRDVINKQLGEREILDAAAQAFKAGVKNVKLYFMIGLPTETPEDLEGIVALTGRVVERAPRGGSQVTVSISPFSPKAHTPFQWAGQLPRADLAERNALLARQLRPLRVKVSLREPEISFLEAVLGLGDARLADAVEAAWREGARFDGWDEHFAWDCWQRAFQSCGLDPEAVTAPRDPDRPLPWDSVQGPVTRDFLRAEWERALAGRTTPDCRLEGGCGDCGACGEGLRHVAALTVLPEPATAAPSAQPAADGPAASPDPAAEHPRWRSWRERASAKIWCRLEFAKRGAAVFLGHLDFQRQLQLALRRSGLPVAYSKGYHRHPLLKFGPPLAVGVAGEREALDLALLHVDGDWVQRLARAAAPDLTILRGLVAGSATPTGIDAVVERCDYTVELPPEAQGGPSPEQARRAVADFRTARAVPWQRRRPDRPAVDVDVRALVLDDGPRWLQEPDGDRPGRLCLSVRHDAKGGGLPVFEVLAAIFGAGLQEPRWCGVTRTGLYGRDARGRWLSPFAMIQEERRQRWLRAHLND